MQGAEKMRVYSVRTFHGFVRLSGKLLGRRRCLWTRGPGGKLRELLLELVEVSLQLVDLLACISAVSRAARSPPSSCRYVTRSRRFACSLRGHGLPRRLRGA